VFTPLLESELPDDIPVSAGGWEVLHYEGCPFGDRVAQLNRRGIWPEARDYGTHVRWTFGGGE